MLLVSWSDSCLSMNKPQRQGQAIKTWQLFEKIKNVTLYLFIVDLNYQEHNQKNSLHEENTQINI